MKPLSSSSSTTISVNMKLLVAFGFGVAAWALWPTSVQDWGFGLFSIILAMSAFGSLINAIKLMLKIRSYEQALRDYQAQGGAPKASEVANADQLHQAGMR